MTLEVVIRIPALDHLADVLERVDLRAALSPVTPLPVACAEAEAETAAPAPLPEIPAAPEPVKPEAISAPEPTPEPTPEPAPMPEPAPAVLPAMPEIRRACAALRDAGKLADLQQLLKACGAKNLSALQPEQLAGFVAGLREMGAAL